MRMSRKKKPIYRLRNVILALVLLLGIAIGREVYLALTATPGSSENFPAKVAALEAEGVIVAERVQHQLPANPHNARYLATKRDRTGHLLR